jgi:predicted protein tyrosine phosphatase
MIDWALDTRVCGLGELGQHRAGGITHRLSILDPDWPDPAEFDSYPAHASLTLRFHDIIEQRPGMEPPLPEHVDAILAFGREAGRDGGPMLIHCHMGVSRSTAAATALLLQANPEADEEAVLGRIAQIRPAAWPSSLMLGYADAALGRGGRLAAALPRFYARQLAANPHWADPLRAGGRGREVDLAAP